MAAELDFDAGALTPVYVLHLATSDTREFSAQNGPEQYRKWAIAFCCLRIAAETATIADIENRPEGAAGIRGENPVHCGVYR